jgi:hypothetical protein
MAPRELSEAELDWVSGGDKPNASGFVGNGDKKVGKLSNNPNDDPPAHTPGAYTPGNR